MYSVFPYLPYFVDVFEAFLLPHHMILQEGLEEEYRDM
jgi:hypothetical protein